MKRNSTSKTRIVALILAIVMAFGLAACSDGQTTIENADNSAAITAPSPEGYDLPRGNKSYDLPTGDKTDNKTNSTKPNKSYDLPRGNS